MKKLDLLKEKANNKECSHCEKVAMKYVAPSIAMSGMYYSTCSCCGNVEIAEETDTLEGLDFTFNNTPKSNGADASVRLMMEDAKASYEAMNNPVKHSCVTEEEADDYIAELEEEAERMYEKYKDMEEDNMLPDIDIDFENDFDDYTTYIIINKDNRLSLTVNVKSLDDLARIIQDEYIDTNISVFEVSRELTIERKVSLSYL